MRRLTRAPAGCYPHRCHCQGRELGPAPGEQSDNSSGTNEGSTPVPLMSNSSACNIAHWPCCLLHSMLALAGTRSLRLAAPPACRGAAAQSRGPAVLSECHDSSAGHHGLRPGAPTEMGHRTRAGGVLLLLHCLPQRESRPHHAHLLGPRVLHPEAWAWWQAPPAACGPGSSRRCTVCRCSCRTKRQLAVCSPCKV